MAFGATFVAYLLVGALLYLIIGVAVGKRNHGVWKLPHRTFWRSIPPLVRDGLAYTLTRARGPAGGYESAAEAAAAAQAQAYLEHGSEPPSSPGGSSVGSFAPYNPSPRGSESGGSVSADVLDAEKALLEAARSGLLQFGATDDTYGSEAVLRLQLEALREQHDQTPDVCVLLMLVLLLLVLLLLVLLLLLLVLPVLLVPLPLLIPHCRYGLRPGDLVDYHDPIGKVVRPAVVRRVGAMVDLDIVRGVQYEHVKLRQGDEGGGGSRTPRA